MKRLVVLISVLMLVGCMGINKQARTYQPVKESDINATCSQYKMEIESIYTDFKNTDSRYNSVTTMNSITVPLNLIIPIIPMLFLDISDTEMKEMDQQAVRYNNLIDMANEKQCGFDYKKLEKTGSFGGWYYVGEKQKNNKTGESSEYKR